METVYQPDVVTANSMGRLEPMSVVNVRRNLFGAVSGADPDLDQVLTYYMSEISERVAKAWNFDFEREQPLTSGRFVWEKVCDEVLKKPNYEKKTEVTNVCERKNTMNQSL
ncbi:uncharacterized protein NPIL_349501 [Nephila pilipes]|uniref:Cyclin-dependent kinase inhibitor domain-containing protein n=1 Tax=Nephila pilipes TaxID=299642 RepID=A0A8X6PKQ8_NEPPI|nr:uncharacterized protein NPIL_349501 [Nephila pilipes]